MPILGIPLYDSASDLAAGETAYVGTDSEPVLYRRPAGGDAAVAVSSGSSTVALVVEVTQTGTTYTSETLLNTTGKTVTFTSSIPSGLRELQWAFNTPLAAEYGQARVVKPLGNTRQVEVDAFEVTGSPGARSMTFTRALARFGDDASSFAPKFVFVFEWTLA